MAVVFNLSVLAIDGGSRYGIHPTLSTLEYFGEIHLFEPEESENIRLTKKYSATENVYVHSLGLGSKAETLQLNILKHAALATVQTVEDHVHQGSQRDIQYQLSERQSISVVRLDGLFQTPPDYLKLDIEGMELDALKGCEDFISHITGIRCETVFSNFFSGDNSATFSELDNWLRHHGFELISLDTFDNGRSTSIFSVDMADGVLLSCDGIWVNKRSGATLFEKDLISLNDLKFLCWFFLNNIGSEAIHKLDTKLGNHNLHFDEGISKRDLAHFKYLFLRHVLLLGSRETPGRKAVKDIYRLVFMEEMPEHHLIRYKLDELIDIGHRLISA